MVPQLHEQEEEQKREEPAAVLSIDDTIEEKPYTDESSLSSAGTTTTTAPGKERKRDQPHKRPLAGGRGFGAGGGLRVGQENAVGLRREEGEVAKEESYDD